MTIRSACAAVFLLAMPVGLAAQEPEPPAPAAQAIDSIFTRPPISGGGAFLRSLAVPGWGQAELGHYGRGAFYFFAESFSLFIVARTQIRLNHAERNLPPESSFVKSRRQQREDWIAMAVFWALFAGADAWISVQLYGFDERTGIGPGGESAYLIGWKIPFGP
ncbi:MAG: hypothetical protein JSU87_14440 [Gemmatimonadota bacterium]|nr:MAG: hypothetical protein JSU87_14440 [Gemmatimonadota bacterium]